MEDKKISIETVFSVLDWAAYREHITGDIEGIKEDILRRAEMEKKENKE